MHTNYKKVDIVDVEDWREIETFPRYSVSSLGRVRNNETGHLMAMRVNNTGIVNVGLCVDGVQYSRAVGLLVAKYFLPDPETDAFDTPINLDGDRFNNEVENLLWRPKWFAVKYHQQFKTPPRSILKPIEDVTTGQRYDDTWIAAIQFGLIHWDLVLSIVGYMPIWPTKQRFRLLHPDIN
jgi:hypothetical protein